MTGSQIDAAILDASATLAAGSLGSALRRFHPGVRGMANSGAVSLADFELGHGPPIGRALRVVGMANLVNHPVALTDVDREYLAWIERAIRLLSALTSVFWTPIRPDIYCLPVDDDDLPAFASQSIGPLRVRHPVTLSRAVADVGLTPNEQRAWHDLAERCRASVTFERAKAVAEEIRRDRKMYGRLQQQREAVMGDLQSIMNDAGETGTRTMEQVRKALRAHLQSAKDTASQEQVPLLRYNALVHGCMVALLGFCERPVPLEPVIELYWPIEVDHDQRRLAVHLTTTDEYLFINTLTPFEVRAGGPLDGVYICTGYSIRGLGGGSFADLWGERVVLDGV